MVTAFLLDTCVISETALPRPREAVTEFLSTAGNYFIPIGAVVELQMGITKVSSTNPLKAVKLSSWFNELINAGIPIIDTDSEIGTIWAILATDEKLQGLNGADGRSGKSRGNQDLHIAAAALARRLPIATFNVKDFLRIHAHYPLPGIFDPSTGIWHVRTEPLAKKYPLLVNGTQVPEENSLDQSFARI